MRQVMQQLVVLLLGLVGLFWGAHDALAQAKVGAVCADSKGKVVVRTQCRSGETKLTLGVLASKAPAGNAGGIGATGASGYQVVSTTRVSQDVPPGGVEYFEACPSGKTTIGGGCYSQSPFVFTYRSYPFDSVPRGWRCGFSARSEAVSSVSTLITYAICVNE